MKKKQLKGSVPSVTPNHVTLTGSILFILTVILRLVTLFTNTDYSTGFYTEKNALVYLFYILAVAGALAIVVLGYISGSMPTGKWSGKKDAVCGFASVGMAACFALTAMGKLSILRETAQISGLNLVDAAKLSGSTRDLIEIVLAFVSVLPMLLFAVSSFTGNRKILTYTAVLFLAPSLWGILRVLSYFATTISYLVVGELFCEMYAAVFLMIFMFCFARAVTDTGFENGAWTVIASGMLTAVFCLLAVLPRLVLKLTGTVVDGYTVDYVYLGGCVFAQLFVLRLPKNVSAEEVPAEADEESDIAVTPFEKD